MLGYCWVKKCKPAGNLPNGSKEMPALSFTDDQESTQAPSLVLSLLAGCQSPQEGREDLGK